MKKAVIVSKLSLQLQLAARGTCSADGANVEKKTLRKSHTKIFHSLFQSIS
jgi:hypothetical protein